MRGQTAGHVALASALAMAVLPACSDGARTSRNATTALRVETSYAQARDEARIDGREDDLVPLATRRGYQGVAIGPAGEVAILQAQDRQIVVFDSIGRRIGKFGRRGEGPGEFLSVNRVGWYSHDLWVYDSRLHRVTVIDERLTLKATHAVPLRVGDSASGDEIRHLIPLAITSEGHMLVRGEAADRAVLALFDVAHAVATSLDSLVKWEDLHKIVAGAWQNSADPFPNRHPTFATSPDGQLLLTARTNLDSLLVHLTVMDLSLLDTLSDDVYGFNAVELPGSAADSVIAERVEMQRQVSAELAGRYAKNAFVPDVYPPLDQVSISDRGTIWIKLFSLMDSSRYVILRRGRIPSVLALPPNSFVASVRGDAAWVLRDDSLGVPSILKYRVSY